MWLRALLSCSCVIAVLGVIPSFKWAQNLDDLYINVAVDCAENRIVQLEEDVFDLSCTARGGSKYQLRFSLREDIVPEQSHCSTKSAHEECVLKKKFPHLFDRLVENSDAFKKLISRDWSQRWSKESEEEEPSDPAEEYEGSPVRVLTSTSLNKTLASAELAVLDVSFPWCTKCSHTRSKFVEIARKLKKKAVFGYVDAREIRVARKKFAVDCEYSCSFFVVRKNEKPYKVPHKHDEKEMMDALQGFMKPLVSVVKSKSELETFRKASKLCVVGMFHGSEDSEAQVFRETAIVYRPKNIPFAAAYGSIDGLDAKPAFVTLYKPFDDRKANYKGNLLNGTELERFVNISSLRLLHDYSWELRDKIDAVRLPSVRVWVEETDQTATSAALKTARQLAKEFEGSFAFVRLNKTEHSYMMEEFGLSMRNGVAVGVSPSWQHDALKYAYEGPFEVDGMRKFLNDFNSGLLQPTYKSEPIPTNSWQPGQLLQVVHKTLRTVSTSKAVLLALYKSWMTEWSTKQQTLTDLAQLLMDIPTVAVGIMDTSKNHFPKDVFSPVEEHHSDVAVFLLKPQSQVHFTGKLKVAALAKFLRQHVEDVSLNWPAVQNKLDAIKAAQRAEEQKKVEAEREMASRMETAEKIDILGDGGVLKQIIREGEGKQPPNGATVDAHYTGTLLDGTEFDSSRARNQPFNFVLGKGNVIKCWDAAFATMKVGERAMLTCDSKHAYGARGSPPKIPPDATLKFDVELLKFHSHDEL